jgi:hypothetical protein
MFRRVGTRAQTSFAGRAVTVTDAASARQKNTGASVRVVAHFIEGQLENADNFAHGASDHLSLTPQHGCSLFDGRTTPEPLNPEHLPSPAWCTNLPIAAYLNLTTELSE